MRIVNARHHHAALQVVNCRALARVLGHIGVAAERQNPAASDGHRIRPASVGRHRINLRVGLNRVCRRYGWLLRLAACRKRQGNQG